MTTALAETGVLRRLFDLWPEMRLVRLVSFDKSDGANWGVPWHQDRVIAVKARADTPGFGNWTRKAGIWHCEPPANILDRMLFVRLHLDPTDAANGAMRIAVGSHRLGLVPAAEAATRAATFPVETNVAAPGDILVLKMLTLHASNPSTVAGRRRALRLDLAPRDLLPHPLDWAM